MARAGLRKTAGPVLERLCARYLLDEGNGKRARDPVAHFHLSNGARIERMNLAGDTSDKGAKESATLMVNYLYDPADRRVARGLRWRGQAQRLDRRAQAGAWLAVRRHCRVSRGAERLRRTDAKGSRPDIKRRCISLIATAVTSWPAEAQAAGSDVRFPLAHASAAHDGKGGTANLQGPWNNI